jgi:alkanesulfonate monooxygenase SsuD/methylene tetrahydromethanopterin reductase-like flavin-dependent oxidoreductase (luciferase family)
MRIGIRARPGNEPQDAQNAEAAGTFGVLLEPSPETWSLAGAAAASTTRFVRLIVRVQLGVDHPITLAEDLAVLDNIAGGRVVALLDTGELDSEAAREDVALILAGLGPRPVAHVGRRWRVPAGLEGHEAPDRIQVTPEPVQIEVPIWLDGPAAHEVAAVTGHPVMATDLAAVDAARTVQPARAEVSGELESDRALVNRWAEAGATHLLLGAADLEAALPHIARYLRPEVAMPVFPRIVAEAMMPRPWPGPGRYVEVPPTP